MSNEAKPSVPVFTFRTREKTYTVEAGTTNDALWKAARFESEIPDFKGWNDDYAPCQNRPGVEVVVDRGFVASQYK